MGWLAPHPGRFTPRKETWYPLYRRLGRPQCWSGLLWKISPSTGFDPRTIQPIVSRYTDYTIRAHYILLGLLLLIHTDLLWRSQRFKIEKSESEVLCIDSVALMWSATKHTQSFLIIQPFVIVHAPAPQKTTVWQNDNHEQTCLELWAANCAGCN
jgi:hypothetical protein